jgi:hypothetical protein
LPEGIDEDVLRALAEWRFADVVREPNPELLSLSGVDPGPAVVGTPGASEPSAQIPE